MNGPTITNIVETTTTGDHPEVAVKNIRDPAAGKEEGTYPLETNKGMTRNNISTVMKVGETRVRSENNVTACHCKRTLGR